jgi:integrase
MPTSYKVTVWKTRTYKGTSKTTYNVRWIVGGEEQSETFDSAALADGFRSQLKQAMSKGEAFDVLTGLPPSMSKKGTTTAWYDFVVGYVDLKWPISSAHQRKNSAFAFALATKAFLPAKLYGFTARDLRTALREWAFNTEKRAGAPADVALILAWVRRNSKPVAVWDEEETTDNVLAAIGRKLNGKPAAASSVRRNKQILKGCLDLAVKRNLLAVNPLEGLKVSNAKTSNAVDKRCLLNPTQAKSLLAWVRRRRRSGKKLHAFFALLYFAGLRPEEAVALTVRDLSLPAEGWGEILVSVSRSEAGSRWTDSGKPRDERSLKGRAETEVRPVPAHPDLVAILREYIANPKQHLYKGEEARSLKPGDMLFTGEQGGELAASVYRRAWGEARDAVLTADQAASPLGKRVYDLRHTCLTTQLNSGVPPAQVAEWAGNSVPVLLSTYAKCISGQDADHKRRIEDALRDPAEVSTDEEES